MSTGTVIFLLVTAGAFVWMFSMHRGSHAHGGHAGGMGGCGGGHNHGGSGGHDQQRAPDETPGEEKKPLLGSPGTGSDTSTPAPAGSHRHRGC